MQDRFTTAKILLILALIASSIAAIIQTPQNLTKKPNNLQVGPPIQIEQNNESIALKLSEQNQTDLNQSEHLNVSDGQTNYIQIIQVDERNKQIFNNQSIIVQLKPRRSSGRFAQQSSLQQPQRSTTNDNITNQTQNMSVSAEDLIKLLQNFNLFQIGTKGDQNSAGQASSTTGQTGNGSGKKNVTQNLANMVSLLSPVKNLGNATTPNQPNNLPAMALPNNRTMMPAPNKASKVSNSTTNTNPSDVLQFSSTPYWPSFSPQLGLGSTSAISKNTTQITTQNIQNITQNKPVLFTSPININTVSVSNRSNSTLSTLNKTPNSTSNIRPNTMLNIKPNTTTTTSSNKTLNAKTNTTSSSSSSSSSSATLTSLSAFLNASRLQNTTKSQNVSQSIIQTVSSISSIAPAKPVTTKIIVNKQFSGIGLFHNIPFTFIQGQVFKFAGIIQNPSLISFTSNIKYNYINVVFSEWGGNNEFRCVEQVTDKNLQFYISCKMEVSGKFFLSIFAGRYGQSSIRQRSILSSSISSLLAPYRTSPSKAVKSQLVTLGIFDNNFIIFWDSREAITNVTIYQPNKNNSVMKRQYILSNYHEKFKVPFVDFETFQEVETYVSISHAQSSYGTLMKISSIFNNDPTVLKFKALAHHHSSNANQLFKIQPAIPWRMSVGQRFKFSGIFKEDVRNQVYLVAPTLEINKVYFTQNKIKIPNKNIKANTPLFLQISFATPGSHIVEINAVSGMAIVNRPVYVGDGYPLIPDYEDLQQYKFSRGGYNDETILEQYVAKTTTKEQVKEPARSSTLNQKRQYMVTLLNSLRKKYGVQAVVMDDDLNAIAQSHSEDMNKRNYFSHTSPEGLGPGERARKMNFTGSIGENIAQSNSLTEAHLGLERSASHLENSVSKSWSRVGVGITPTRNEQYIVAFEFSSRDLKKNPLTKEELKNYQQKLVNLIKERNPNIVEENQKLSEGITQWMESNRGTQMFQYIMRLGGFRGPMVSSSFTVSFQDDWVDQLRNTNLFKGYSNYNQVGVGLGIQKSRTGMIQGYVVFA